MKNLHDDQVDYRVSGKPIPPRRLYFWQAALYGLLTVTSVAALIGGAILASQRSDLRAQNAALEATLDALTHQNGALRTFVDASATQHAMLQSSADALTGQNTALEATVEALRRQNAALQATVQNPITPTKPSVLLPTRAPLPMPTNEPQAVTPVSPIGGTRLKSPVITFKWTGGALQPGFTFLVEIIPYQAEMNGECVQESDYRRGGLQYSPALTAHEWTVDIVAVPNDKLKPCAGPIEWVVYIRDESGKLLQSTPRSSFVWNPL